jgi:hypothetical protein
LQRTPGNQAVQRLSHTDAGNRELSSRLTATNGVGHDFSRIPVFHRSPVDLHRNSSGPPAAMPRVQVPLGDRQIQQFFDGGAKEEKKTPETKKAETKKSEPKKPPSRESCDNKCGTAGGPYGNTECELDLKSGLLTGKVTQEVFDRNPCTRPCVEVHEGVHAKKIAPICAAAKKCLDAAGGDDKKQSKCLDTSEADLHALTFSTECAAYAAEEECLSKRAKEAECKSADGKKRWDEQMNMVKCYKGCFCK